MTWTGRASRRAALFAMAGPFAASLEAAVSRATVASQPVPSRPRVHLEGRLVQGGLVTGQTVAGARVSLDKRTLRVADDGIFVCGFGRNATRSVLEVEAPDGGRTRRVLTIRSRRFRVQRINGLPERMVTPPPELMPRILAEQSRLAALWGVDSPEPLFTSGFDWPARGPISGVYGSQRILNGKPRQVHWGVDIAAPEGAPIVAPADGIVVLSQPNLYYTGDTVLLDHGFGLISGFLHMSARDVTVGQRLRKGDPLGKVGATGRVTGPHLDWRVRWFEVFVDPQLLVPPMKG